MAAKGKRGRPAGAKKAAKPAADGEKKGVKKPVRAFGAKVPKEDRLSVFIYKVLKQVHPQVGISKQTMGVLNDLALEVYQRLCNHATELVRHRGNRNLTALDVQSAIKLSVPGELAKHATSEVSRAVTQYELANQKK